MSVEAKGYRMGWDDAARYVTGDKSARRAIRRRLVKSDASSAPFWASYRDAFAPRADDFAAAILSGRLPRTVNPHKLSRVIDRCHA